MRRACDYFSVAFGMRSAISCDAVMGVVLSSLPTMTEVGHVIEGRKAAPNIKLLIGWHIPT
ncbi:hypothetical protein FHS21_001875 [Phyllobacterium trifolii]|jgi:hypothetical protein|uniref:Uncharacterized protein n=1 Tax=Phyllobacterium trifolii TaxID=300193 RepID=A0A839U6B7_9HYPH|nr:hypothetical protein [Phyllobacterium trifolii]